MAVSWTDGDISPEMVPLMNITATLTLQRGQVTPLDGFPGYKSP